MRIRDSDKFRRLFYIGVSVSIDMVRSLRQKVCKVKTHKIQLWAKVLQKLRKVENRN